MAEPTCSTCRFWSLLVDDSKWPGVRFQQCRRYPPVIRVRHQAKDDWGHACFPATSSGAWCGEYAPAKSNPHGGDDAQS